MTLAPEIRSPDGRIVVSAGVPEPIFTAEDHAFARRALAMIEREIREIDPLTESFRLDTDRVVTLDTNRTEAHVLHRVIGRLIAITDYPNETLAPGAMRKFWMSKLDAQVEASR